MDLAIGTAYSGRIGDDDDYDDDDISFNSSDDEAIIYHMKLAEERKKKNKRKRIEKETKRPKRPRDETEPSNNNDNNNNNDDYVSVAATVVAAATQTKNNGDEDIDDDSSNNFNARLYKLNFIQTAGSPRQMVPCPVDGCLYQTKKASLLRRHFFNRHPTFKLHLEEDGNAPRFCQLCGVSVSLQSLRMGHEGSTFCNTNVRKNQQREAAATQTKNNGDEDSDGDDDDDGDDSNNFNVSLISGRNKKGITMDMFQTKWMNMYYQLVAYKKEHNTLKVTSNCPKLYTWVFNQRTAYKNKNLSEKRYSLLDSINFHWGKEQIDWMEVYQRLVAYKKEYINTNVPQHYDLDRKLGAWVNHQRYEYKNKNLSEKRCSLLNLIGFDWGNRRIKNGWMDMYQRLVAYKKEHNTTRVPMTYDLDRKLGHWVSKQRYVHNNNAMLEERCSLLDSIGFVWSIIKHKKRCNISTTSTSAIPPPTRRKKLCASESDTVPVTIDRTSKIAVTSAVRSTSTHSISSPASVSVSASPSRGKILDDVGSDDNDNNNNNNMQEEDIDDHYHHPYASLYAMATTSDEYLHTA
jgi:hypothetical protein